MSHPEIFNEIMRERGFAELPDFYRVMIPFPRMTAQFWQSLKVAMAPGVIDAKTKEMIAIAISIALNARYAIDSHIDIARGLGMTDDELDELLMLAGAYAHTAAICAALKPAYASSPSTPG
ncbi:carboxymuconolactone decarboxylase family protein [Bosea sp. 117]|uniref:carboxymuconolactone decarboxylase family protein n=1 Tax=Bosea sp. 117 TaxID=1125973 RepID=UPI00068EA874|nr:carboxymuconolactone decarboxylase family protein [Bosea sp. 117]